MVTTADRAVDPLAEVLGRAVVAGSDSTLHLRPAEAAAKLLERHGLNARDIALWEINEAFAGVVLASARSWASTSSASTSTAGPSRSVTHSRARGCGSS